MRSSGEWRNLFTAYCGADRSHPIAYHRSRSRAFCPGSDCGSRNTLSPQGPARLRLRVVCAQSPDFEPPLASPGVGFYLLFTSPKRRRPTVLGLGLAARPLDLVFFGRMGGAPMAVFSLAAPANPPTRQTECLSPHQVRVCDLPSARQWIPPTRRRSGRGCCISARKRQLPLKPREVKALPRAAPRERTSAGRGGVRARRQGSVLPTR